MGLCECTIFELTVRQADARRWFGCTCQARFLVTSLQHLTEVYSVRDKRVLELGSGTGETC